MPIVQMYATAVCPYCQRARRLLHRKGVEFEEIRVDHDRAEMKIMIERSRRHTVPQIFIGAVHVGGYDDMAALDAAGGLDPLLFDADEPHTQSPPEAQTPAQPIGAGPRAAGARGPA